MVIDDKTKKRFFAKTKMADSPMPGMDTPCLEWTASGHKKGYGQFWVNGMYVGSHRIAWIIANGEIQDGMCACHRCDNPKCVRAEHLFLGTRADNIADKVSKGRQAKGDKHGLRLHPESIARGDRNGSRLHPERLPRGEKHWSRVHPERIARGDRSGLRLHPESACRGDKHWSRLYPELRPRGERNGANTHPECLIRGEAHYRAKLKEADVLRIIRLSADGRSQRSLANEFGVSKSMIANIVHRTSWKHINFQKEEAA